MQISLFLGSLMAAASVTAASSPPACLLATLGKQGNPADTKTLCQDLQDTILDNLTQKCDDDTSLSDAYEQFAAVCSDLGIKVNQLPSDAFQNERSKKKKGGSGGEEETETATGTAATATSTSDSDDSAAFVQSPSILYLLTGLCASTLAGAMLL